MKPNIYIFQVCGIILLLLGYLFSNTPDSLSDMHFNLAHHTVMTASSDEACPDSLLPPTKISAKHDHKHKSNVVKHISFAMLATAFAKAPQCLPLPVPHLEHTCSLRAGYSYLYYREVNPPPPRLQRLAA